MEKMIRWGILGPGWISEKFAAALRHVPHAELYAVGSRSQERAGAFARKHGIQRSYGSYERLVEDKDVDVVYVATPHPLHCANTLLCLEHGKAVLCEKPFAMNEKEVRLMITKARERRLFLMEAMWSRFLPSVEKVLELILAGEIGDVVQVKSDLGFRAAVNPDGRLYNPALGGGSLLDVGVYPAFMATLVLGEPDEIRSSAILTDRGIDTSLSAVLSYRSGALATISCAITAETATETEIAGTRGTILMHRKWFMPNPVTVRHHDGRSETYEFFVASNGYECEAIEVTNCLLEGKTESPRLPLDFSLKLIRVLDTIRSQQGIAYEADKS
jgi:predicted dehydrogenase